MINRDFQRLFDLVRFCRAELLKEGLITEDEYSELLTERGCVDRLQKYDRMQKRIKELEAELAALKKEMLELAQEVNALNELKIAELVREWDQRSNMELEALKKDARMLDENKP